jgi:hypothetical protein
MTRTRYPRIAIGGGKYCYSGPRCRVHGILNDTPQAMLEKAPQPTSPTQAVEAPLRTSPHPVTSAINSSLKWTGEAPEWWSEYKEKAMADPELPTTPELLDVIDSPMGKLAVIWHNESQAESDRYVTLDSGMGIYACYYKSFDTGEELGRVGMTHMTTESVERTFGNDEFTPFRWQARFTGTNYHFREGDTKTGYHNLTGEALLEKRRETWLDANKASRKSYITPDGEYVAPYDLDKTHIPDDKTVQKDLKVFYKTFKKEMDNKRKYYSVPYVDFSEVKNPLKGKGFGAALYIYTAQKLGAQGKVLRGSGLQSDSAQGLWKTFNKHFSKNVSKITLDYNGEKSTYPILDFRKTDA